MKIPGRRKKKDEDEYEEEDEAPVKKKRKRKKKKEPQKPWGRKERILIMALLIITIGASAVLALSAREWKLPGLPRLKLPSISLPFIGEEMIVIEGNKNDQAKADQAISEFNSLTRDLSGVYGLYVIRLSNGSSYGVNKNETFEAASLIKLPVMAAMYMEEESGSLSLSDKYKLREKDRVGGAGSLSGKPAGYTLTYRDLIRLMGKQSDNTAFNITRNLLGDERIAEVINQAGMTRTDLVKNEMSPLDAGIFFEELWNGNVINEENRDELLGFLTDTIYEEHLAAGVPDGIRVSHKYGREVHVVNDAGIVYLDNPIIVVLISKGVVESEADKIYPELSRIVFEVESN